MRRHRCSLVAFLVTHTDVPMISRSPGFPPELGLNWPAQGYQYVARLEDDVDVGFAGRSSPR